MTKQNEQEKNTKKIFPYLNHLNLAIENSIR